jgi:hypothetical protein
MLQDCVCQALTQPELRPKFEARMGLNTWEQHLNVTKSAGEQQGKIPLRPLYNRIYGSAKPPSEMTPAEHWRRMISNK